MKKKLITACIKQINEGQEILVNLGEKRYPWNSPSFISNACMYSAVTRIQTAMALANTCGVFEPVWKAMIKANEEHN